MLVGYRWLHSSTSPMDPDLPIMISEAGSSYYPNDPERTADWYAQVPAVLQQYPQVKAVGLWNHRGTGRACDFRFGDDPTIIKAVSKAGHQPWVNSQRPRAK
jgi:hypothetical protein